MTPAITGPWDTREGPNSTAVYGPTVRGCAELICRCTSYDHAERARQIAALPDLLAACKRALHLVEENNEEVVKMVGAFGLYADLKTAIDLAEGRTA